MFDPSFHTCIQSCMHTLATQGQVPARSLNLQYVVSKPLSGLHSRSLIWFASAGNLVCTLLNRFPFSYQILLQLGSEVCLSHCFQDLCAAEAATVQKHPHRHVHNVIKVCNITKADIQSNRVLAALPLLQMAGRLAGPIGFIGLYRVK